MIYYIKTYTAVALVILALIVIFQNAAAVSIRFLVWDFSMSLALLLPLVLGVGFAIGWIVAGFRRRKKVE